jgi:LCP family protein required for cell wall assembly
VHEELAVQERKKQNKRAKFMPAWLAPDAEMEKALIKSEGELASAQQISGGRVASPGEKEPAEQVATAAEEPQEEPAAEPVAPLTRLQTKKIQQQDRVSLVGKVAAISFAVAIFIVSGLAYDGFFGKASLSTQVEALDESASSIRNAADQGSDNNFLVVGSNSASATGSKSVMIVHVPQDHSRMVIVSVPQDTLVSRPTCNSWDQGTGTYGASYPGADNVKIGNIYTAGGPKCVTEVVQQLTGLRINHFADVDLSNVADMVGVTGPLSVCESGQKSAPMDGAAAVAYASATGLSSSVLMAQQQQRVFAAILNAITSQHLLVDPTKKTALLSTLTSASYSQNMTTDQLQPLADAIGQLSSGQITFATVPTSAVSGGLTVRTDDSSALFTSIIDNAAMPGETGASGSTSSSSPASVAQTVDPSTVNVQIFNAGNTTDGIGKQTASKLTDEKFRTSKPVNAPNGVKVTQTVIRYSAGQGAQAQALQAVIPKATLAQDNSVSGVALYIGPDYSLDWIGSGTSSANTGATQTNSTSTLPNTISTLNAATANAC